MKKVVMLLVTIVVVTLSGCESRNESVEFNLEGRYEFFASVYKNPLSNVSELGQDSISLTNSYYIEFKDSELVFSNSDATFLYENIEYKQERVNKDIDELFSLDEDDIIDEFERRYDVYVDNESVGLSVFLKEDKIFIAETTYLGENNDVFSILNINEVRSSSYASNCEKVIYQLTLSGTYYIKNTYICETSKYSYDYTSLVFSGYQLLSETISISYLGENKTFVKCEENELDLTCDGSWNLVEPIEQSTSQDNVFVLSSEYIYDLKKIDLSWFEPVEDSEYSSSLLDDFDLVVMEEHLDDVCNLFFGEDNQSCTDESNLAEMIMYLRLDQNNDIHKIYYSTFPTHELEFIYDEIYILPEEIIQLLPEV